MSILSKYRPMFDRLFCRSNVDLHRIGDGCPWTIDFELFMRNPILISGGVGNDISFEKELVDECGAEVHLFDPSDTGVQTMQLPENIRPNIQFYPMGLASESKVTEFMVPERCEEGSFTKSTVGDEREVVTFNCISVSDFVLQKDISAEASLKLDIEGFEYDVLDDVLMNIPTFFSQICVELHHFLPGHSLIDNWKILLRLYRSNYRLVHKTRQDYLFIRKELIQ